MCNISKFNSMDHSLSICPVNRSKMKPNDSFSSFGKEFREVDFGTNSQNLQAKYLDMYEGIQLDIVNSSRFDKNSDISTTYLGKIGQEESQDKLKAEESFPISEKWLYFRKITRWYEMSVTFGYRCQ